MLYWFQTQKLLSTDCAPDFKKSTDFADLEKSSTFFSASGSVCSFFSRVSYPTQLLFVATDCSQQVFIANPLLIGIIMQPGIVLWHWEGEAHHQTLIIWGGGGVQVVYFWKPSKHCHVGIHWIALTECSHISTNVSGFQSFFQIFCLFSYWPRQISHHQQHKVILVPAFYLRFQVVECVIFHFILFFSKWG